MPTDTDRITDTSPPELADPPQSDDTDVDTDDRVAEEAEAADEADILEGADEADILDGVDAPAVRDGRFPWKRLLARVVLPALALVLALGAGYLKWLYGSAQDSQTAAGQSVRAATDTTIALLSYRPDTVDRDLTAAADRLTGSFRDQYKQLVGDVVAPGAKQQHITAAATVPAAASVSATGKHAVVLVFVNQTTTIGNDAPTQTASSVRVTLDKVGDRWLISQFDPV